MNWLYSYDTIIIFGYVFQLPDSTYTWQYIYLTVHIPDSTYTWQVYYLCNAQCIINSNLSNLYKIILMKKKGSIAIE